MRSNSKESKEFELEINQIDQMSEQPLIVPPRPKSKKMPKIKIKRGNGSSRYGARGSETTFGGSTAMSTTKRMRLKAAQSALSSYSTFKDNQKLKLQQSIGSPYERSEISSYRDAALVNNMKLLKPLFDAQTANSSANRNSELLEDQLNKYLASNVLSLLKKESEKIENKKKEVDSKRRLSLKVSNVGADGINANIRDDPEEEEKQQILFQKNYDEN